MKAQMKKEMAPYKVRVEIPVKWGDMDAFHHVNNTVYLKWIEHARVEYLRLHILGSMEKMSIGPILARQDIRYIFPITYPDTVTVGYRVAQIEEDRLLCEAKVWSNTHQRLSAIAYVTIMAYDFIGLRKADVPVDWVMKIQDLED